MGKLTWKAAKLHLDFSFFFSVLFVYHDNHIEVPLPTISSAEVWSKSEVWGLLLPD